MRALIDRLLARLRPPACPACRGSARLTNLGRGGYLCQGCGQEFRAARDRDGDWTATYKRRAA